MSQKLRVERKDINDYTSMITFLNEDSKVINFGKLQQGNTKLMKGKVAGVINGLKELLTIIGIIAAVSTVGYATYEATEVLKEIEINKDALDNYIFYAQSLDTNILLAFLNEVNDNLYEKEASNSLSNKEVELLNDLQNELRKIEELQLFYDQAIASGNEDIAKEYLNQIKIIVTNATVNCGDKGHIIGSTDYYKYIRAIIYNDRIMFLASDVDREETGFEDTITFTMNGVSYITTPEQNKNMMNY